jgi:CheY-like chemotaxis protein
VYLLQKALQRHEIAHTLTCVADGERAIATLSQPDFAVPDLILVDLKLPRRNGFDVLLAIRALPRLAAVPVGIFTSSDAERDRHRVSLQGVDRYLVKPADYEQFLEEIGLAVKDMLAG